MDPAHDALLDQRSSQELADLRRRAYGPDADIQRDPVALARLAELEAVARPAIPAAAPSTPSPALPEEEPTADLPAPAPADGPDEAPSPPAPAPRRVGRWVWALAGAVAVLAAVLSFWFFTRPQPADTLVRAADASTEVPSLLQDRGGGFLQYIDVEPGAFEEYESYLGIVPWVAPRRIGGSCVVLTLDGDALGYGCGLGDLPATADLVVDRTDDRWRGFSLEEGSILRFTLRGDVLDVVVARPAAATPAVTG